MGFDGTITERFPGWLSRLTIEHYWALGVVDFRQNKTFCSRFELMETTFELHPQAILHRGWQSVNMLVSQKNRNNCYLMLAKS